MGNAERVLLVDDDSAVLDATRRVLMGGGYEVITASSAEECRERLSEDAFELILLDVVLPDGDGVALCQEIKNTPRHSGSFVVLLSSLRIKSDSQAVGLEGGADGYIARPIPNRELLARVESLMRIRQAEAELKSERTWLHRTLCSVGDAVLATDSSGRILFMNPVAEELTGWPAKDAVGRLCEDVLIVVDEVTGERKPSPCQQVLTTKERIFLDTASSLVSRSGQRIAIADSAAPILDGEEITGVVVVFQDIRARRQLENQMSELEAILHQNQRLEAIGTLASGTAHEINNPLMGMMGYAELLRKEPPAKKAKEYIDGILHEGRRIAQIVKSLLSYARTDGIQSQATDIGRIVEDALALVRTVFRHDQIEIDVDIPEDLPRVSCQPGRIQQIIVNLLVNARDALNARYPSHDPARRIRVRAEALEDSETAWLRLTIADSGEGIHPENLERLFDPFFSTKSRSTNSGLGLFVSRGIAQEHGGRLTVQSDHGMETRFHIDLPLGEPFEAS